MNRVRSLVSTPALACALLLCGCASPFSASWYRVKERGEEYKLYIAILNHSTEKQDIIDLVLNPSGETVESGWRFVGWSGLSLGPGDVLVRRLDDMRPPGAGDTPSRWPECSVPVAIAITTRNCAFGSACAWLSLKGGLPNALPQRWEDDCKRLGSSTAADAPEKR